MLTAGLSLQLLTVTGDHELIVDFETVQVPNPEILMQAKLQFSKKRIFDFI